MKKTIKFSFAALVAVALASCSGDDLLGNGNNPLKQSKGGLTVEVENMVDELTTRVAWTPDGNEIAEHWQSDDQIWVMDNSLTKYDIYSYDAEEGIFKTTEDRNAVKNPEYALFHPNLTDFGWKHETQTSEVIYTIPSEWEWAEDAEAAGEGIVAYMSSLPLWGTVTASEDDLSVKLRYLTAILRISLGNVPGNATGIVVRGYSDLSGDTPVQMTGNFKAILETIDGVDENAVLEPIDENVGTNENNVIKVSLKEATNEESWLFIPIIARYYGLIQLSYTTDEALEEETKIGDIKQYTATRGGVRRVNVSAFETAGNDIPALNRAIDVNKEKSEIEISTSKITEVTADENTIVIPEGITAKSITLDLKGFNANSKQILSIVNAEGVDYAGDLIIKIPADADLSSVLSNVYVNLPSANVSFAGNWGGVDLGNSKAVQNSLVVKTLAISADAVVKGIYPNAECCENNTDATADITVAQGADENASTAKVTTLTLPNNTKIDNITINDKVTTVNAAPVNTSNEEPIVATVKFGAKANITTLNTNQTSINVTKGATIATLNAKNGGTVTVAGKVTTLNGDNKSQKTEDKPEVASLTINGVNGTDNGFVGTANVRGANVTIAKTAYVNAIGTALNMGENKRLTLTGGIIVKLNEGTNLTFSNTEKYPTSITNVAAGVTFNENGYKSTWCGTAHTQNITPTKVYTDATSFGYEIMTASQFVKWAGTTTNGVKLAADIDLNDNPFTPNAAVSVEFDGNYKTISKVSITSEAAAGLFKTLAANGSVKNLLINGIGINQTKTDGKVATALPVGALVSKATGGTITNVNVNYATLESAHWVVGGLIGEIAGDVTIAGKTTKDAFGDDAFSTVSVEIKGQNMLGGLVGKITSGEVTISNYKSDATFTVSETATNNNRKNFGTVAPFVGTAKAGKLTATTGLTVARELTYAEKTEMGFNRNQTQDNDMNIYYFAGRKVLGYVDSSNFTLVLKGTTGITTATTTVKKASDVENADGINVYLLEDAYTD